MKIGKCKKELARIISERGGWRNGEFAAQDGDGGVGGYGVKPVWSLLGKYWRNEAFGEWFVADKIKNHHQTVLSREEYFHLYPAPDADGWIEWKGGECPVEAESLIDVKFRVGATNTTGKSASDFYWKRDGDCSDIIAYRLHKPEQAKPELCESVMRSIPEPIAKPTIEQLAADYRNAKDYAERKQLEADAAKVDADAKLKALELACEALGLLVSPITAKQEPELVITDRSQLELGDVIWLSDSTVKENNELTPSGEYTVVKVGVIGVESDGQTIYPDFSTREWRFIRRP